jgi:hypothetical protein
LFVCREIAVEPIGRLKLVFPAFVHALEELQLELVAADAGMGDAELRELEVSLGVPLPASYKRLLGVTQGFHLADGVIQFGRQHPFFHETSAVRSPSAGMLCFGEFFLGADGDQVLFDVSSGLIDGEYPVMYYAHESPPEVRRVANGFEEFLNECLYYPEWGWDED